MAGFIIILHSLVPHQHGIEYALYADTLKPTSNKITLGYLDVIFQIDIGEGHLENFAASEGFDFDNKTTFLFDQKINPIFIQPYSISTKTGSEMKKTVINDLIFPISHYFPSIDSRGPLLLCNCLFSNNEDYSIKTFFVMNRFSFTSFIDKYLAIFHG